MTFLRLTSLFAAAALALAAAASGALAPSDYRAQANAACAKAKAQSKAFGQTAVNPTAAEVVKSVAGALERRVLGPLPVAAQRAPMRYSACAGTPGECCLEHGSAGAQA